MTQEEKAKAYDELLVKAKKIYNEENDVLIMHTIEDLFPKFKENEDENFRKYILKCCEETISADDRGLELSMGTTIKLKSWLEKQGEQPSTIRWYDMSLMPQETEELLVEWDGEDATWHEIAFYHADTKTFWNGPRQVENVTRWCYVVDLLEKQDKVEKEPEEDKKIRADIAEFIFKSQENIKDRSKWIEYLGYMPTFVAEKNEIQK